MTTDDIKLQWPAIQAERDAAEQADDANELALTQAEHESEVANVAVPHDGDRCTKAALRVIELCAEGMVTVSRRHKAVAASRAAATILALDVLHGKRATP